MPRDYLDAAKRLYTDAESLFTANRYGSADHLFGLAAECALLAALQRQSARQDTNARRSTHAPQQHPPHLPKLWDEFVRTLNGRLSKSWPRHNPFDGWFISHRYESDRLFTMERTARYRKAAGLIRTLLNQSNLLGVAL